MLSSKLRLRRAQIPRIPIPSRWYNWGNYDASSGECCKMRDKDATACKDGKWFCPVKYEPNKCYKKSSFGVTEYPQYLQEIYNRGKTDPDCLLKLIRHDTDHYKPSDKSRKFQRTWPECPLLWLRPKDTCCPNPEIYMPMDRRIRPPQEPPLSAIDKHLFQMSIFCNAVRAPCCKVGRRPPNCTKPRRPSECCKKCTPMPSFSEACRHLIPRFCGSECACRGGSLCEMWNTYNKCNKTRRSCMKPFIGYSPLRSRMRFPF